MINTWKKVPRNLSLRMWNVFSFQIRDSSIFSLEVVPANMDCDIPSYFPSFCAELSLSCLLTLFAVLIRGPLHSLCPRWKWRCEGWPPTGLATKCKSSKVLFRQCLGWKEVKGKLIVSSILLGTWARRLSWTWRVYPCMDYQDIFECLQNYIRQMIYQWVSFKLMVTIRKH